MAAVWRFCMLLLTSSLLASSELESKVRVTRDPLDRRLAVVANGRQPGGYLAFATNFTRGSLSMSVSPNGETWGKWVVLASPVPIAANPVGCHDNMTGAAQVFVQGNDGQVYIYYQTGTAAFQVTKLTTNIPTNLPPFSFSANPLKCILLGTTTHVIVRSQSDSSRAFWSYSNGNKQNVSTWSKWVAIGGSEHLAYDPYAVINSYLNRIEVFAVFDGGHLLHTWQSSGTSFADKWHELCLFPPKFNSAPVAHSMGKSFFNGMIRVFARDEDGTFRTISQTTCDKVKNPWGPCTWEVEYHKLGGKPPANESNKDPFAVNRNIHFGIEVFTVGASDHHLYHIWQAERDGSWSNWEDMGPLVNKTGFNSGPAVVIGPQGWWEAFALTTTDTVARFVQTPLTFSLSATSVAFDHNVTVSWAIPKDEATHQDWIGVYPSGANNHKYVDYAYVGGSQNPLKDPVPVGKVNLMAVLPNGKYDYRYMVNHQFDNVLEASLTVYNATTDPEWVQLYRGIARGLGSVNTNVTLCVEDGNKTVDVFKEAFEAFENRKIFDGLHLLAEGLEDFRDALIQCNETKIIEDLTKFIEDLIACTEDACTKFVIDVGLEVIILFENRYEIYGDILGAHNSLDINAYEQGGICIGRVTNACLTIIE